MYLEIHVETTKSLTKVSRTILIESAKISRISEICELHTWNKFLPKD